MPLTEIAGRRLFYRLDGPADRPVAMLSNSLGTDHGLWDPQLAEIGTRYRLLRYDNRGHGRSPAPDGPVTVADLGGDALALIDRLGLERVRFMGLSLGGMVGMWLAIHAPGRVERLILCNTSAYIGQPEVWNPRIETVRRSGMKAIVPGVVERWFTPGFRERDPGAVEQASRMLLATTPAGYVACCEAIRDMDQRDSIEAIRAPSLVIAGAHDVATPVEHARLIVGRVPGARLVTLDAAHLSNIEQAARFTSAVLDFLGP